MTPAADPGTVGELLRAAVGFVVPLLVFLFACG